MLLNTLLILYYSTIKKNETIPFGTTWMGLEIIILSELTWTEKDKYHMIYIYMCVCVYIYVYIYMCVCVWNLKY